jgi:hypothetical protein
VVADPQKLGQREAGEHRVGGVFQNLLAPDSGVDKIHLRLAALVAPDQRRADHLICAVQNHQAMHLTGEPDSFDLGAPNTPFGEHAADGFHDRVPPVFGALLGP